MGMATGGMAAIPAMEATVMRVTDTVMTPTHDICASNKDKGVGLN